MIKTFGRRGDEVSDGINIEGAAGQPVVAVSAGRVVRGGGSGLGSSGHHRARARVGQHLRTQPGSLGRWGTRVAQGDVIARLGATEARGDTAAAL